jgi:hypothetical protein
MLFQFGTWVANQNPRLPYHLNPIWHGTLRLQLSLQDDRSVIVSTATCLIIQTHSQYSSISKWLAAGRRQLVQNPFSKAEPKYKVRWLIYNVEEPLYCTFVIRQNVAFKMSSLLPGIFCLLNYEILKISIFNWGLFIASFRREIKLQYSKYQRFKWKFAEKHYNVVSKKKHLMTELTIKKTYVYGSVLYTVQYSFECIGAQSKKTSPRYRHRIQYDVFMQRRPRVWQIPMVSQIFPMRNMGRLCAKRL